MFSRQDAKAQRLGEPEIIMIKTNEISDWRELIVMSALCANSPRKARMAGLGKPPDKTRHHIPIALLAAFLTATSALHADSTQNKLPFPMPEFMSQSQVVAWQKERIAKADAARASQAASSRPSTLDSSTGFYTGKPYLAESGSYAFKYREYNPEMNRWTTVDPSGFPDGANNRLYAPNGSTQIDPTGLLAVNVTWTPQTGDSGSILSLVVSPPDAHPLTPDDTMIVTWQVNASYSGYIVQHVVMNLTGVYNSSNGSKYTSGPTSYNYWEAWQVVNRIVEPTSTDQYTLAFPSSTYGTASITGTVNFFQNSVFSNQTGNNNPSNWGIGDYVNGAQPAGGLLATTANPQWWSGSGYNHNMNMTWE